jgi:hyperosmotically inducible periplasmic protein
MNSQTSRKIIVASGMAVAVGIAVTIFALRSHPVTSIAETPRPPSPATQIPTAAPAAVAQIPDAPAAVPQVPDAPAEVAHNDSVGTTSANTATASSVENKLARNRHLAKAGPSTVATNGTDTNTESAANTSEKPAAETVTNRIAPAKSVAELTTMASTSSPSADDQKVGTSTEFVVSDSQITTDVKSEIAGDSLSKDLEIGVTTTHGVVALTGSLASQGAIDHVKDVAGKVKDVKSVDASALILASL